MGDYVKNNKYSIVIFSILLLYIAYVILDDNSAGKKSLKHPKYTVGLVGEWHFKTTWKTAGSDFFIKLNGKEIRKTFPYNNLEDKVGKKYLVLYDSLEPHTFNKYYELLHIYPLPDSIEAPPNGWRYDEVPIPIDSVRIRKYVLGEE